MPTVTHYQTTGQALYAKPSGSSATPWDSDAVPLAEDGITGTYTFNATEDVSWTVYLQIGASQDVTDPVAGEYTPTLTTEGGGNTNTGTESTMTKLSGTITNVNSNQVEVSLSDGVVGSHLLDTMLVVTDGTFKGASALVIGTEGNNFVLNESINCGIGDAVEINLTSYGFYREGGRAENGK